MNKIAQLIAEHEGLKLMPYRCTAGKLTIGYGHNLDDLGISREIAEQLLVIDISNVYTDLYQFDWFRNLDEVREAVVVNMVFNLGINRFKKFKKTIEYIEDGNYTGASIEMLDSAWSEQVGDRAQDLSQMMFSGRWV